MPDHINGTAQVPRLTVKEAPGALIAFSLRRVA
jgi:hypothetical protein